MQEQHKLDQQQKELTDRATVCALQDEESLRERVKIRRERAELKAKMDELEDEKRAFDDDQARFQDKVVQAVRLKDTVTHLRAERDNLREALDECRVELARAEAAGLVSGSKAGARAYSMPPTSPESIEVRRGNDDDDSHVSQRSHAARRVVGSHVASSSPKPSREGRRTRESTPASSAGSTVHPRKHATKKASRQVNASDDVVASLASAVQALAARDKAPTVGGKSAADIKRAHIKEMHIPQYTGLVRLA